MMLWDIIRDWFVANIWGGMTSNSEAFYGFLGYDFNEDVELFTNDFFFKTGGFNSSHINAYVSLGDWLSTTSTIIVLIALCFFFFHMVRWLFRLTAGLIQGRG